MSATISPVLSVNIPASEADPTPGSAPKSLEKFFQGVPFDPDAYRRAFPGRWAAFLHAHHPSVEQVAFFYNVTGRTAQHWWSGTHRPTGDKVALAAMSNPDGFKKYLRLVG